MSAPKSASYYERLFRRQITANNRKAKESAPPAEREKQFEKTLGARAKRHRKKPTPSEALAKAILDYTEPGAVRYQVPIGPWIADIVITDRNLVIELDGAVHDATAAKDKARDARMRRFGIKVLRIRNEQVYALPALVSKFPTGQRQVHLESVSNFCRVTKAYLVKQFAEKSSTAEGHQTTW